MIEKETKETTIMTPSKHSLWHSGRSWLLIGAEILILFIWTLAFTRPYLNLDPDIIPSGTAIRNEYIAHISAHHFWTNIKTCGLCGFWNGSMRGGSPALVSPFPSMLHPIVAIPTLVWGVPVGAKLALIGAFFLGGVGQWWLGYVLGVGRVARVWGGAMAVVAGHLAGRMELGGIELVISTASCALILPPLLAVTQSGSRRMAVVLGVVVAMAIVSGQGYMQIGLLGTAPAIVLLWRGEWSHLWLIFRRYALALLIAILLASPFLVPFLHFSSQFAKPTDELFQSGQPLPYLILNLVINDRQYFYSTELDKLPYPYMYVNFIGWIPLALAIWGVVGGHRSRQERKHVLYLLTTAMLALILASDLVIPALAEHFSSPDMHQRLASIRFFSLFSMLAVPPLLGLATLGIDRILQARVWWRWAITIPLVVALMQGWAFGREWVMAKENVFPVEPVLDALETPDSQWIALPPFLTHAYVEPAVRRGFKLTSLEHAWQWKHHSLPLPVREANDFKVPANMTQQEVVEGMPIYVSWEPERAYAAVVHGQGDDQDDDQDDDQPPPAPSTVCRAQSIGGTIDVFCETDREGMLIVKENWWHGWQVAVARQDEDNQRLAWTPVEPHPRIQWLTVELPAGSYAVHFRYRPWDVPLGVALSGGGMLLAGYVWRRGEE
jgi:hypothetical protein